MLESLDEFKRAEMSESQMINGVDSPSLRSVDSTAPITTDADVLEEVEEDKAEEKVEEEVKAKEPEIEEADEKKEIKPRTRDARIDTLTKKWRAAERDAEYQRTKRLEAESALEEVQKKIPSADKPQKIDFDDEIEYLEALTEWKIEQSLQSRTAAEEKVSKEVQEQEIVNQAYQDIETVFDTGNEKYEDFSVVMTDKDLSLSTQLLSEALDSDMAVDVLYYLGTNPDESARISALSPSKIAKEVAKIEFSLEQAVKKMEKEEPVKTEEKKPEKKTTKAPPPITPIKTDGVVEKDPNKMSMAEYRAWRESHKQR